LVSKILRSLSNTILKSAIEVAPLKTATHPNIKINQLIFRGGVMPFANTLFINIGYLVHIVLPTKGNKQKSYTTHGYC
jgi:hypothetical protein